MQHNTKLTDRLKHLYGLRRKIKEKEEELKELKKLESEIEYEVGDSFLVFCVNNGINSITIETEDGNKTVTPDVKISLRKNKDVEFQPIDVIKEFFPDVVAPSWNYLKLTSLITNMFKDSDADDPNEVLPEGIRKYYTASANSSIKFQKGK